MELIEEQQNKKADTTIKVKQKKLTQKVNEKP